MNNRGAIPCTIHGVNFPSQLEANTYLVLKRTYRQPIKIASANDAEKILIKPATEHFPAIYWKPDFYLPKHNLIIESKGKFEKDWVVKMKFLEYLNSDTFKKIILVCSNSERIPYKGAKVLNLRQLESLLQKL